MKAIFQALPLSALLLTAAQVFAATGGARMAYQCDEHVVTMDVAMTPWSIVELEERDSREHTMYCDVSRMINVTNLSGQVTETPLAEYSKKQAFTSNIDASFFDYQSEGLRCDEQSFAPKLAAMDQTLVYGQYRGWCLSLPDGRGGWETGPECLRLTFTVPMTDKTLTAAPIWKSTSLRLTVIRSDFSGSEIYSSACKLLAVEEL